MAILHMLRFGVGDDRVASSTSLHLSRAVAQFGAARVRYSPKMPTVGSGPVNPVSNPTVVILEVTNADAPASPFSQVGYFLIEGVLPNAVALSDE